MSQKKIEAIAAAIRVCDKCPLHQTRTQAVPGEGSATASLFFVGEGPGKNEDERGQPFVGAAGSFLDELIASIDLNREDVFITNVVKCRPPENRDPEEMEISICTKHYLLKQIETINPLLVIPLGRYAMAHFLPNDFKISQVHGRVFRRQQRHYYPLYHPAAALYNGSMRPVLLNDFKKIPKVLEKIKDS